MEDRMNNEASAYDVHEPQVNQTIYINNINEKIRKEEVRRSLYVLCSQFGPILDVVSKRTPVHRGQAFITFRDISAATSAIVKLKDLYFYGKKIRVSYARSKSDIVARIDGNYRKDDLLTAPNNIQKKRKARNSTEDEPYAKKTNTDENPAEFNPVNRILFVQRLSESATEPVLTELFSKIPGFESLKVPPGRSVAIVFYENEVQATKAMYEFQNLKISSNDQEGLFITYARQ